MPPAPARRCLEAHGAVDVGHPPGQRFDPGSLAGVIDALVARDEAQPLAGAILDGFVSGLIQVGPEMVVQGRFPSHEDVLVRLVAAHQELAQTGEVLVASEFARCKLESKAWP